MMCENCGKKEIDGEIMIGGITLKVCSPKCMEELLKKKKCVLPQDGGKNGN